MVRIGIVGLGHLGLIHLRILRELQTQFQVVGVYDHNHPRKTFIQSEYPDLTIFDSYQALLEAVEAVAIIASTAAHYQLAKEAIMQKKAVFVEKPLCAKLEDAQELEAQLKETSILFQVGHIERFNPVYTAFLANTNPIAVSNFSSKRTAPFQERGTDVSVVLDLMIHDIDLLLSLHQAPVQQITVNAKQEKSNACDEVEAQLTFADGMHATLFASRIATQRQRTIEMDTNLGKYYLDLMSQQLEIRPPHEIPKQILATPVNAIQEQWLAFYACYRTQQKPVVDIMAGLQALKLATEIEKLAEQSIVQMNRLIQ